MVGVAHGGWSAVEVVVVLHSTGSSFDFLVDLSLLMNCQLFFAHFAHSTFEFICVIVFMV